MPAERLQKIIAAAGIASRRKAEELIAAGRVVVNGQVVTELGTKADAEQDHIRVDGKLLQGPERYTYLALNKPKGYVTTVSDEKKRPTVMDLVQKVKGRVYPVGRLDWASEGLLLMTNDGELANGLMKASSNVPKVYVVKVAGQPDEGKLDKLRRGVSIAEKGGRRVRTAPAKIRLIREGDNPWLEVTIIEGRNRQVRKMFEEVGHHVEKIRRVQYGPLALDVPPGDWRNLTLLEVAKLKTAAAGGRVPSPPTPAISLSAPKPKPVQRLRVAAAANAARPFTPRLGSSRTPTSTSRFAPTSKLRSAKPFGSSKPTQSSRAPHPDSSRTSTPPSRFTPTSRSPKPFSSSKPPQSSRPPKPSGPSRPSSRPTSGPSRSSSRPTGSSRPSGPRKSQPSRGPRDKRG
jgi:23S rRNA pseudouridine2605 synthase